MVFFEWKDEYELGLPDIDLQHTMIVNMLNELHVAIEAGDPEETAEKTLAKMLLYVEEHFAAEETAMYNLGFSGYEAHAVEHEVFREKAYALNARHRQGQSVASDELIAILVNWLKNHIAKVDQVFGRFVHEQSEQARKSYFSDSAISTQGKDVEAQRPCPDN